jgi:hypothetical protein
MSYVVLTQKQVLRIAGLLDKAGTALIASVQKTPTVKVKTKKAAKAKKSKTKSEAKAAA